MTEYSDDQITSKGQQKREDNALQELGLLLMDMKQVEREPLPLRDDLQYALVEATRITSHEARRRHADFSSRPHPADLSGDVDWLKS